jgi:hypothetical protein
MLSVLFFGHPYLPGIEIPAAFDPDPDPQTSSTVFSGSRAAGQY